MEQSPRQGCVPVPLVFNIVFAAIINVLYTRPNAHKDTIHALVHLRKKIGAARPRGATTGEPGLAMLLWDMLYVDDAGVSCNRPTSSGR